MLDRVIFGLAAALAATASATAFEVEFDFSNVRPCAGGALRITPSPEFRLADVPDGTAALDFFLADITVDFDHGGRELPYAGGAVIAADSFKYVGPCPTSGTHTYEWTVRALDAAGAELGAAKAQGDFTATP